MVSHYYNVSCKFCCLYRNVCSSLISPIKVLYIICRKYTIDKLLNPKKTYNNNTKSESFMITLCITQDGVYYLYSSVRQKFVNTIETNMNIRFIKKIVCQYLYFLMPLNSFVFCVQVHSLNLEYIHHLKRTCKIL